MPDVSYWGLGRVVVSLSKSHKSQKTGSTKPRQSPQGKAPETTAIDTATPPSEQASGVLQELPPEKQWWYRAPDSKSRKLAEKIAVMREAGRPDKDIAKKLGIAENSVKQTAYLARKNGWWDAQDEVVDVEAELAFDMDRKIVRNASAILDGQMTNWQTFELTKEGLKGRGMFKQHEKTENVGGMQVVAIQVVMPAIGAGDQAVEVSDHNVGGTPAYLEGEVEDAR